MVVNSLGLYESKNIFVALHFVVVVVVCLGINVKAALLSLNILKILFYLLVSTIAVSLTISPL